MLSRLISLLRRIPAVKWAFTLLRSSPHGGGVDVAQSAPADSAAITNVVQTAPAPVADIGAAPFHEAIDLTVAAAVAENETAVRAVAESPPTDVCASDAFPPEPPTEAGAVSAVAVLKEISPSSPDLANDPAQAIDVVIIADTSSEILAAVEPVVTEVLPLPSAEAAPVDVPNTITGDGSSLIVSAAVDPLVDEVPAIVADCVAVDAPDTGPAVDPSLNIEITPPSANDLPHAAAIAAETPSAEPPAAVANLGPPAPVTPTSVGSVRKVRARPAEPADRAALIRQRWAETGIRMWNPRLHGSGEATLNIQGSVGLLPPASGETMPRYDKLEFKMLGGQIICEGVIVEAPVHASQRNFTRLAEPAKPDRVREPVRERQAALA